jgi:hypothetical protein
MNRRGFFGMLAGLFGVSMLPKQKPLQVWELTSKAYPVADVLDGGVFRLGYNSPTVPYEVTWPKPEYDLKALRNYIAFLEGEVKIKQRRLASALEVLRHAEGKG